MQSKGKEWVSKQGDLYLPDPSLEVKVKYPPIGTKFVRLVHLLSEPSILGHELLESKKSISHFEFLVSSWCGLSVQ